jgi:hypothetical protein
MVQGGPDKRRRRRVRTRRAASIELSASGESIPCVLWDQSETGARIAAPHAERIPAAFALALSPGEAPRPCHVVWRRGTLMGVHYAATMAEAEALARAKPPARRPEETAGATADSLQLLAPGRYAGTAGVAVESGFSSSRAAGMFVLLLIAATVVFYVAGQEVGSGSVWALNVCRQADNFCRHPEFSGGASILMAIVYFAIRGMER